MDWFNFVVGFAIGYLVALVVAYRNMSTGCAGNCNQGRLPCDCKMKQE